MGTNTVPYLIRVLDRGSSKINDWSWRVSYRFTNGRLNWYPVFDHEDAAYALAIIGPEAVEAAPALIRSIKHHPGSASTPPQALNTLRLIGDGAIPHLERALFDPDKEVQERANWALGEFLRDGSYKEMRRLLLRALNHQDEEIRLSSAQKLMTINYSAAWRVLEDTNLQSAETIVAKLQLQDMEDRQPVIEALDAIRPTLNSSNQNLISEILIGLKNYPAGHRTVQQK